MSQDTTFKLNRRRFLAGSAALIGTPALAQETTGIPDPTNTVEIEKDVSQTVRRNISSFRSLDWRPYFSNLRKGAVLVDVAIDQGGCFETSRATTHAEPTFDVDGIIHYCVANMPGSVPRTSSHALNNATLPYGLALAAGGLSAFKENAGLRDGLSVHRGMLTSEPVAESLGVNYTSVDKALAA